MAAMATALKEFSDQGNSREYTLSGHTAIKPSLVLQKRKVAQGNQVVIEDTISVLQATEDAASLPLAERVLFTVIVRRPKTGIAADVTSALATFRDIIAGDEFGNTVNTQEYLS